MRRVQCRVITLAASLSCALLSGAVAGASAQVAPDTVRAYKLGVQAANARPVWPFFFIGFAGGIPVGMAAGDLPNPRPGSEAKLRPMALGIGAVVLVGGSVAARELFTGLPGRDTLSTVEAIVAGRAYEERLKSRRMRSQVYGLVTGLLLGFTIMAFAPR